MDEYHKIQTVYLRDPETKHKTLLEGQFALPEFEYLQNLEWVFTEKVDGTNIRVMFTGNVRFGGRSDNAQIPVYLLDKLNSIFTRDAMLAVFPDDDPLKQVCLYGEGYGARIQKGGGNYIPDGVDFILFDVNINGTWLIREDVEAIAESLECKVVPIVGRGPLLDAVYKTREGLQSLLAPAGYIMEGLVMRPAVELKDRRGHRIISKVKYTDFAR